MKYLMIILISLLVIGLNGEKQMKKNNHLMGEKSPYLLQHQNNPVDWYPWSAEAFEKAEKENKPIFLSIGYATCHWCHVMAHESFEDESVAALLNKHFISIKVDREERPDIDHIYMQVCQMMTGSGGWPLTVFLTPKKKPFFAATYIPKNSQGGRIGMLELVPKIASMWQKKRDSIRQSAEEITRLLNSELSGRSSGQLKPDLIRLAREELKRNYDQKYGGFGGKPKFPSAHKLTFLLQSLADKPDPELEKMVEDTLIQMRLGGIYDQVGFGFHRYSTDEKWRVPHFEKMLYDQAILASAYLEAYHKTGKPIFRAVVEEIVEYIQSEMVAREGGFYSAQDADSEGVEGKYYVWTLGELKKVLDPKELTFLKEKFSMSERGNYLDEVHQTYTGANIPYLDRLMNDAEKQRYDPIRKKMLVHRKKRTAPLKDTKILTDWNGLMIAVLARSARILDNQTYLKMAIDAAEFCLSRMMTEQNRLWHRFRDGETGITGKLDDYAFLIFGLLELYEASFELRYLEKAIVLNRVVMDHFHDREGGAFFMTADFDEKLIARPKEGYDGAMPSGNSIQILNLLRLSKMTGDSDLIGVAEKSLNSFAGQLKQVPSAFLQMLSAYQMMTKESLEIVISGRQGNEDTNAVIRLLNRIYLPNKVVLLRDPATAETLGRLASYTRNQQMVDQRATVYICRGYVCKKPETDLKRIEFLLRSGK